MRSMHIVVRDDALAVGSDVVDHHQRKVPGLDETALASLDMHPSVVYRAGRAPEYTLFSDYMAQRGVELIETSTEEREAMCINYVATAPLQAVGWSWATRLTAELEKRGGKVWSVDGAELVNGNGGPHCLTCPIERERF